MAVGLAQVVLVVVLEEVVQRVLLSPGLVLVSDLFQQQFYFLVFLDDFLKFVSRNVARF